ncbi:minor tail protein [Rhodococcus phage Finch]|uniref:Uncharacterized protein n=1 Tax=Rhodococcus phage Finch TaxID=2094144 RepID=A0A2P1JXT0_9CAUD|nr:minor tail protein [Rhodococcus phage Finch]AVO25143.1 hypothetical protein SEA_FINCH_225 [Rhodococcus phage Finch]
MPPLKNMGRPGDTDASMMTKETIDARFAATSVSSQDVTNQINAQTGELVTKTYVDQQDSPLATKLYVDNQDGAYVNLASRGVANGVAQLGADGKIPAGQLGTIPDRRPVFLNGATISSFSPWTISSVPGSYRIAQLSIPDPGWPYRIFMFASVENRSSAAGGSIGRVIAVLRGRSNLRQGHGTSSSQGDWNRIKVLPCALPGDNGSQAGFTGSDWLDLYAEKQSGGSSHIFTSYQLQFSAVLMPVI